MRCLTTLSVLYRNLSVQRPEVIQDAEQEQTAGTQVNDPGDPLAHVHAVYTEQTQERQQNPGHAVVGVSGGKTQVCLAVHAGDQKQVDQPANT